MSNIPCSEVEASERAVAMEKASQRPRVAEDPRHVAAGRERPQHRPAGVFWGLELSPQRLHVDQPIPVHANLHHLRQALPPRQDVGVVLVRANKHDPSLLISQTLQNPVPHYRGDCDPHRLLQSLDTCRGSRPTEEQCVATASPHATFDVLRRLTHHLRRLAPDEAVIGVRVT